MGRWAGLNGGREGEREGGRWRDYLGMEGGEGRGKEGMGGVGRMGRDKWRDKEREGWVEGG